MGSPHACMIYWKEFFCQDVRKDRTEFASNYLELLRMNYLNYFGCESNCLDPLKRNYWNLTGLYLILTTFESSESA